MVEFISMITTLDLYCVQLRLESQQPRTVWDTLYVIRLLLLGI